MPPTSPRGTGRVVVEGRGRRRPAQARVSTKPRHLGSCWATDHNNPHPSPFGRRHIAQRAGGPQNEVMASVEFGRTISGLPVKPVYTADDVNGRRELPGE